MTVRHWSVLLGSAIVASSCFAQGQKTPDWQELVKNGKCQEAKALCQPWIGSTKIAKQAEGHKCLANVALCGKDSVYIDRNDIGGGTLDESSKPEAIDEALKQLDEALKLTPQDLSIHEGRLTILLSGHRYDAVPKALDESCTVYKGKDVLHVWLGYVSELYDGGQLNTAMALSRVLERHYPNSHEVLGNIGAILAMQKEDDEAIRYLKRAVELAPNDPIDAWNLGRLYDYTEHTHLADQWYQKGLALDQDADRKRDELCIYGEFVEKKLHDRKRGCSLQKENCTADTQSDCTT